MSAGGLPGSGIARGPWQKIGILFFPGGELLLLEQVQFPGEQHELGDFWPVNGGYLHILVEPDYEYFELIILKFVGILTGNQF
jgi:hypothetical protein